MSLFTGFSLSISFFFPIGLCSFPFLQLARARLEERGANTDLGEKEEDMRNQKPRSQNQSQLIIEDLSGKKHFRYAFSTEDKSSQ